MGIFRFLFLIIETFFLKVFFKEEEYNLKSKDFNAFKLVMFFVLIFNNFLLFYVIYLLVRCHNFIKHHDPTLYQQMIHHTLH